VIERKQIPVGELVIDTAQSRQGGWENDEQDRRLVNSLERDGLMQSLLVRPVENTPYGDDADAEYAIVAGSRRYHAAVEAGFETVHCRVIDADDFEAAKKSLKENEERKDLTDQERARSLKMQFEMLRPDPPVECPECGGEFEDISQHWVTAGCESVNLPSTLKKDEGELTFYTDKQVYEYLAAEHLGSTTSKTIDRVRQLISVAELPDELQALWKQPELRTAEERETLQKFNIDRDLSAQRGGDISRLGEQVLSLHRSIEENTDADAVNTTNATLETLGRLDIGDMSSVDLQEQLQRFKSEVKEIGQMDSAEAQEREFRARLENHEKQLRELNEELDSPTLGRLNFRLNDQRYKRYHARAKQTLGVESDAEVVRKGYQRYLEQQADQHGWSS
jgi:hypothetical protein